MEEIRSRLRMLRAKMDISQGEFAEKMGVKQSTWANIENGTNPCSDRYVNLICLTYSVRKEWLMDGQGEMLEPETRNPPQEPVFDDGGNPLPPEMAELIAIYKELVPPNQKAVRDFVETTLQSQRNTIRALEK
jgi:transcriptional regulator with XRE-family HTH domain